MRMNFIKIEEIHMTDACRLGSVAVTRCSPDVGVKKGARGRARGLIINMVFFRAVRQPVTSNKFVQLGGGFCSVLRVSDIISAFRTLK